MYLLINYLIINGRNCALVQTFTLVKGLFEFLNSSEKVIMGAKKRGRSSSTYRTKPSAAKKSSANVGARYRNQRTAGFMNLENKFADYEVANQAMTTTWTGGELNPAGSVDCLSACAQGDGEQQRDGRKYHIVSIHVRGQVKLVAADVSTTPVDDAIARIAVVWDKQTNGAELAAEDVYDAIATAPQIYAMRNLQKSSRFVKLKEKRFRLPVNNTTEAVDSYGHGAVVVPFSFDINFKTPISVSTTGTTAAVSTIVDNSIHLIGCASSTSVQISYFSRMRFRG